uniref:Uncharacterized protein n=1 Tax=Ditylenchus dipsaci TaxID=166011 RepID=A0A915DML5_9BILA
MTKILEANGKFKAILFDMGGVIIRYKNPEIIQSLTKKAQAQTDFKKVLADYEIGISCVEEINHLFDHFFRLKEAESYEEAILEEFMGEHDEHIAKAIAILKQKGYKIGLLTNNGYWSKEKKNTTIIRNTSDFDLVIESCRVGLRKPDPKFFKLAAEKLDLECHESAVGMTPIQVVYGDGLSAVKRLESLLAVNLV